MLGSITIRAQNLELVGKSNSIKVSGGISSNQVYFLTSDSSSTRQPLSTVLSGNVNFSIYEWSIPLSFTWSNQNYLFQQPFNRYSMHPKYKWITGHIGYTSMSFSPYSLNGQIFTGVGIDLTPPGKFSISAMYGRFQKAIEFDSIRPANTSFSRMGYGIKTQYKLPQLDKFSGDFSFIFFHAQDDRYSISFNPELLLIYDSLNIAPRENMVLSTSGNFNIMKNIRIGVEFSQSALTRNMRDTTPSLIAAPVFNGLGFKSNASTSFFNAFKTNVGYSFLEYTIGVGYERVEPDYSTLGAYYFTNDFENITLNTSGRFIQNKLSAAYSIGKQRDNLDNKKSSQMDRWVNSLNLSFSPNSKFNLSTNYSTFQSYTNAQSKIMRNYQQVNPYAPGDTLNYVQLSQSAGANATYSFVSNESRRKSIMLNFNWQTSSQKQSSQNLPGVQFYNVNTVYVYGIVPMQLNISVSLNSVFNITPGTNNKIIGPAVSVSKMLFNKTLRTSLSLSTNNNYLNNDLNSRITTLRSNNSFVWKKKHNINLSMSLLKRNFIKTNKPNVTDFTATLGYSYGF
jgi:hypothetical protein